MWTQTSSGGDAPHWFIHECSHNVRRNIRSCRCGAAAGKQSAVTNHQAPMLQRPLERSVVQMPVGCRSCAALLLLSPSVYKTARDDLDKTVEPVGNNNPDLPLPFYIHLILVTGSCSKQGILSKVPWLFLGYRSLKWETHCANTDLFINIATWHLHMHEAVWARTPGVGVNRLFVSTGAGVRAMTARHQSE